MVDFDYVLSLLSTLEYLIAIKCTNNDIFSKLRLNNVTIRPYTNTELQKRKPNMRMACDMLI